MIAEQIKQKNMARGEADCMIPLKNNQLIMKKNIVCMILFVAIVLGPGISCSKKVLDQTPVAAVSDDAVFNSTDPGLLTAYVNNI